MGGEFGKKEEEGPALPTLDRIQEVSTEYLPMQFDMDQLSEWQSYMERSKDGSHDVGVESDGGRAGSMEAANYFFTILDTALGVATLGDSDASGEDQIKAGASIGSELLSLVPGFGHVAPAVTAGTQTYDETKAGSHWLKKQGFFGSRVDENDETKSENRDAAQLSSDVGKSVGSTLHWDGWDGNGLGFSEGDAGLLSSIVGGEALLASSVATGVLSAAVGTVETTADTVRPIGMWDESKRKDAVSFEAREQAATAKAAKSVESKGLFGGLMEAHNLDPAVSKRAAEQTAKDAESKGLFEALLIAHGHDSD